MHSDIRDVVAETCQVGPQLSIAGRQLLPRLRANLGHVAPSWPCGAIAKELAKKFVVQRTADGEELYVGLTTIPRGQYRVRQAVNGYR